MPFHRSLAFHSAMAGIHAESRPVRTALVIAGRFDRAAIMREAVRVARSLRAGGKSWSWRMGVALRTVWGRAKRELQVMAVAPGRQPAPVLVRHPRPAAAPVRVFHSGSRIHSHGW